MTLLCPDPLAVVDTAAAVEEALRILCERPEYAHLVDDLIDDDGLFTPHEGNLRTLVGRMQGHAVEHGWIPIRLITDMDILALTECFEAGRRPWHLSVLDRTVGASGVVFADKDVNRTKCVLHLVGLPVHELLDT